MKNKLRKGCAVAVIILFLGIAFASSINANITRESELARNTIWIGVEYTFYYTYEDPEGDKWYVMVSWGDGTYSGWMGPYDSGETVSYTHYWTGKAIGISEIKTKVKDEHGNESEWSEPLAIRIVFPNRFFRDMEINGTLKSMPRRGIIFNILNFDIATVTKAISKKVQLDPFTCHNYKFITLFLNVHSYNKETLGINASTPFAILIDF